ncbi:MAG: hypothetical protein U1E62_07860 [Alsobacter sp.]
MTSPGSPGSGTLNGTSDKAPLPALHVRVGVTGHRPNKLPDGVESALRETIGRILAAVGGEARALSSAVPAGREASGPELVLISSLAEGTDRIAARAALDLGWSLQCPLPFSADEYEKDFDGPVSRADFRDLLGKARSVFVLDAARGGREGLAQGRPYEAAGLVMEQACDLMIAVWDGGGAAGVGGTALVIERALADMVPVLAIDPVRPGEVRLMWPGLSRLAPGTVRPEEVLRHSPDAFSALPKVMATLLAPPESRRQAGLLEAFLGETDIRWTPWCWYPLLLGALGIRRPGWGDVRVGGRASDEVRRLSDQWGVGEGALADATRSMLIPAFVLSDRLAVVYAGLYRSAFVFNYLAAAAAVGIALSGLVFEEHKGWLVSIELILIICIFVNTYLGWRQNWHRRWMDYRRLAETLRHMRFTSLVGSGGRLPRPAVVMHEGERDWVGWYARSLRRALPLPNATVDEAYLSSLTRHLRADELAPQIAYHQSNWRKMNAVGHRLHVSGLACFVASIATCAVFLLLKLRDSATGLHWIGEGTKLTVTIATAFFPTLGASLNAIRFQGDFEKTADRSLETLRTLKAIDAALEREEEAVELTLALVSDRIDKIGVALMSDLEEWHMFTETRPLSLPA